ncbi:MAG: cyclic nucleotide-binding/CBS domain-containing protein [Thermodesulfobacteriota bacterium]
MKTAEDILSQKHRELVSIPADRTVREAVERMNDKKIGAILVTREDAIAGIWTERDLIRNFLQPDFHPDTDPIGNHMTTEIHSAPHDAELTKLQEMFLGLFIRHILIKKKEAVIGLLSIGDVLRALLLEKDHQIKELNTIAGWEYYENWGWDKKK